MTARSCLRSWRRTASGLLAVASLQAMPATTVVECLPPGDAQARAFRLVDRGAGHDPRWWLTLSSRTLGGRTVELPLPGPRVELGPNLVSLSSASSNGGLMVTLEVGAGRSTLDVFVNYELEVNVWRDLSPDVEQMNTSGPLVPGGCRLASGKGELP
jgi:hypothetical protein